MADIFISYAREDKERVRPIVEELEKLGWSVFWDRKIPPGQRWESILGKALGESRCVLVVWSEVSITSDWVKDEATDAKKRGIFVPVVFDAVEQPMGFRQIQAADLSEWKNNSSHQAFQELIGATESIISFSAQPFITLPPTPVPDPAPAPAKTLPPRSPNSKTESNRKSVGKESWLFKLKTKQGAVAATVVVLLVLGVFGFMIQKYAKESTVIVPVVAKVSAKKVLKIGDKYCGGIVFYVDSTGHGLIAATSDISTIYTDEWDKKSYKGVYSWSTNQWNDTSKNEKDYAYQKVFNTSAAIGQGASNTKMILAKYPAATFPYSAAAVASGYREGGYSDWFLPSMDDLKQLYLNRRFVGGFAPYYYWSSTEQDSDYASYLAFGIVDDTDHGLDKKGVIGHIVYSKNLKALVRPVRRF